MFRSEIRCARVAVSMQRLQASQVPDRFQIPHLGIVIERQLR